MNVDVQTILAAYEREIGALTRRAVVAETALAQYQQAEQERAEERDQQAVERELASGAE